MKLSRSSVVKISKEAVYCDVEDEVVILGMTDGVYYGLNPVGAFIWNQIQEPKKVEEIRDLILEEFDIGLDECEADLMELLGELQERNLIEVQETFSRP